MGDRTPYSLWRERTDIRTTSSSMKNDSARGDALGTR
jgi:hypothetical protein